MPQKTSQIVIFSILFLFFTTNIALAGEENINYLQPPNVCAVQQGDSIWRISRRFNVKFQNVMDNNDHLGNKNLIHPGDKVHLLPEEAEPEINGSDDITEIERRVVELTNQKRVEAGLEPYQQNHALSEVARTKSEDMRNQNYFSHQSPTYGSPFEMMDTFNINYRAAGENIAKSQHSPQEVVNSWMDSPGHRKNILSENFTEIGVGYAEENGERYWTQMFIHP